MKDFFGLDLTSSYVTDWGYSEELTPKTYAQFESWVNEGNAGELKYLTDHRKEIRKNLKELWPKSESAVVFLFSYLDSKVAVEKKIAATKEWNGKKISGYVFGFEGDDYHHLLSQKLMEIGEELKKKIPNLEYKIALDLHPHLDRDLAFRAGLGWYGKNSMFISKTHGSFTLIGSLIFNQKLSFDSPKIETDHCGQCTRCIDACPTSAILGNRTISVNKCISTFTIETFKEKLPPEGHDENSPWIFGCDICQDVCPWNKRLIRRGIVGAKELNQKQLGIIEFFLTRNLSEVYIDLKSMSKKEYLRKFARTSFERLGKNGMLKNLLGVSLKEKK